MTDEDLQQVTMRETMRSPEEWAERCARLEAMVGSLYHWILELDRSGDAYDYSIDDYIHWPEEADAESIAIALEIWPKEEDE